jgi:hypothetical protein
MEKKRIKQNCAIGPNNTILAQLAISAPPPHAPGDPLTRGPSASANPLQVALALTATVFMGPRISRSLALVLFFRPLSRGSKMSASERAGSSTTSERRGLGGHAELRGTAADRTRLGI